MLVPVHIIVRKDEINMNFRTFLSFVFHSDINATSFRTILITATQTTSPWNPYDHIATKLQVSRCWQDLEYNPLSVSEEVVLAAERTAYYIFLFLR